MIILRLKTYSSLKKASYLGTSTIMGGIGAGTGALLGNGSLKTTAIGAGLGALSGIGLTYLNNKKLSLKEKEIEEQKLKKQKEIIDIYEPILSSTKRKYSLIYDILNKEKFDLYTYPVIEPHLIYSWALYHNDLFKKNILPIIFDDDISLVLDTNSGKLGYLCDGLIEWYDEKDYSKIIKNFVSSI